MTLLAVGRMRDIGAPVILGEVEVHDDHVRVEWRTRDGALPVEPEPDEGDEWQYAAVELTDDAGTHFERVRARTHFQPEPRGVLIFEPGPPQTARALRISCAGLAFEVPLGG